MYATKGDKIEISNIKTMAISVEYHMNATEVHSITKEASTARMIDG